MSSISKQRQALRERYAEADLAHAEANLRYLKARKAYYAAQEKEAATAERKYELLRQIEEQERQELAELKAQGGEAS